MFKWFMTKTLITKIIIVTLSVVLIGGVGAGVIIVSKQIEKYKQEEQLSIENDKDLANMSIVIKDEFKTNGITLPLNLVTQGIETVRYTEIENVLPALKKVEKDKEKVKNALIKVLVDSYTGGELSVEENIDINKRGDYPVTFTVTSEKGNTKSEIVNVKVFNFCRVQIYLDGDNVNQTKTITKGTDIDIMEGVTFNSNLPEEEQGHIETTGTVDVNTVGTYTVTYTYIPKDKNEEVVSEMTRTYKVVDSLQVKQNVEYVWEDDIAIAWVIFNGDSFKWCHGYKDSDYAYERGTYTISNGIITFHATHSFYGGDQEKNCNETFTGKITSNGKSIIIDNITYTYKVVDSLQVKQNVRYVWEDDIAIAWVIFNGDSFEWCYGYKDSGYSYERGTYTISNGIITFYSTHIGNESYEEECNETFIGKITSNGKSIIIDDTTYSLK